MSLEGQIFCTDLLRMGLVLNGTKSKILSEIKLPLQIKFDCNRLENFRYLWYL